MAQTNVQAFSGDVEISSNVTAANSKFSLDTNGTLKQDGVGTNGRYIKLMKYFSSGSNWKIATGSYTGPSYQWLSIRAKMTRLDVDVETIQFNYYGHNGISRVRDSIVIGGGGSATQANEIKVYNRESNSTYEIYLQIDSATSVEVEITHRASTIDDDYSTVATANNGAIDETGLTKIYDSGTTTDLKLKSGNVGIGKTDPVTALDVLGTIRVQTGTNDATGNEFNIDTNVGHIRRKVDGNGVSLTSYDDFQFYVNATDGSAEGGTQAMIIDGSGSVGIGLANPSHGRMQILCSSPSPDGGLTIRGGDFAGGLGAMWVEGAGSGQRFYIQAYKNEGTDPPSGVNPSVLDADVHELCLNPKGGNVGIGTNNPDHTLTVAALYGDAEVHIQAQGNDGGDAILYFNGSPTNQRKCAIISSNVAPASYCKQDLHFCMETTGDLSDVDITDSKMVITNAGNVGIGTTNPKNSLHLFKASTDQTSGLFIEKQNSISGTAQITFGVNAFDENTGVAKAGIFFQRGGLNGLGSLKFAVDSNSDGNNVGVSDSLITLQNNYYVGFGPNLTPETSFHFVRNTEDDHLYMQFGKARNNITVQQFWKPYMFSPGNSTNTTYAYTNYYSNGFFIGCGQMSAGWGSNYYGGNMDIRAGNVYSPGNNGSAHSTNYYGGNVDIQAGITRTSSASGQTSRTYGGSIRFWTQNNDTYANTDATLYERMRVDGPSGNVGIGTGVPGYKLHVNGDMRSTGRIIASDGVDLPSGYGYCAILAGTGDNASYTLHNSRLRTWWSFGVRDHTDTCRIVFNARAGDILGTGTVASTSDDRIKINEKRITRATDTILKLDPQLYHKTNKSSILPKEGESVSYKTESGLIAQDIWYDAPELRHLVLLGTGADPAIEKPYRNPDITIDPDYSGWGPEPATVNYVGLIPYLIKSVQEIATELPNVKTGVSNVNVSNVDNYHGLIVSANKPDVYISTSSYDTKCYGVVSEENVETINNEILINTSRDGKVWVIDVENLQSGDYITTSNVAGYGMKQSDDLVHNYTVAKILQDCDFNPRQVPIKRVMRETRDVTYYVRREYSDVPQDGSEAHIHDNKIVEIDEVYYTKSTLVQVEANKDYTSRTFTPEITEEAYDALDESDRESYTVTYFNTGISEIRLEEYESLSTSEKEEYEQKTRRVRKILTLKEMKEPVPGHEMETRTEEVDVLDSNGQLVWEETGETRASYIIKYIDGAGVETDEANAVHRAALVNCKVVL
jgi:hypothetical protein